jgi:hypothetical protein
MSSHIPKENSTVESVLLFFLLLLLGRCFFFRNTIRKVFKCSSIYSSISQTTVLQETLSCSTNRSFIQLLAFWFWCAADGSSKWIKVKEGRTLREVLQDKGYIVPAIPGLFLQSLYALHIYSCSIFSIGWRIIPSLHMQCSLLFQESPPSIKTSRLEIGLCHETKLDTKVQLKLFSEMVADMARKWKMPAWSWSFCLKGVCFFQYLQTDSLLFATVFLDWWRRIYYRDRQKTQGNVIWISIWTDSEFSMDLVC